MLRNARELACERGNDCPPGDYLEEAYMMRMQFVLATYLELLRSQDGQTAAEWRSSALARADVTYREAWDALRIAASDFLRSRETAKTDLAAS